MHYSRPCRFSLPFFRIESPWIIVWFFLVHMGYMFTPRPHWHWCVSVFALVHQTMSKWKASSLLKHTGNLNVVAIRVSILSYMEFVLWKYVENLNLIATSFSMWNHLGWRTSHLKTIPPIGWCIHIQHAITFMSWNQSFKSII